MATNSDLSKAARNKKDEFYTELNVIEDELHHYKEYFKDKKENCKMLCKECNRRKSDI